MKYRIGPVANSSSSSYVCEITGEAVGVGQDEEFSLEDIGFAVCFHGHEFLNGLIPEGVEVKDLGEVPEEHCPVCAINKLRVQDIILYATSNNNLLSDVLKPIKAQVLYHSRGELWEAINEIQTWPSYQQ